MPNDWLKTTHPVYEERKQEWLTVERRFRGGRAVLEELVPFDWETDPKAAGDALASSVSAKDTLSIFGRSGSQYESRQAQAVYQNFADAFATAMVGHLFRKRPTPERGLSFGTLGKIDNSESTPSRAKLVYYNVNGVGNDGSQWDSYWANIERWAMATGHRWIMVESPRQRPRNRAEEAKGQHPYLLHLSPLDVLNWEYEEGRLAFAVMRFAYRRPRVVDGKLEGSNTQAGYRLMVRRGIDWFGPEYAAGGWFDFDKDGDPMVQDGVQRSGNWDATDGDIPLWAHFYERDEKLFSRSGIYELCNAAVACMNLDSAGTFDLWDDASSLTWLVGVDTDQFAVIVGKIKSGSKLIPIPPRDQDGQVPQIQGKVGANTSAQLDNRIARIRESVMSIAQMEASSGAASSGLSKVAGFNDVKSPRLALMASEIETSQNTALRFIELRFGNKAPKGSVTWTREFELVPIADALTKFFEIQNLSGVISPTATTRAMVSAASDAGLVNDDADRAKIEAEYAAQADSAQASRDAAAQALASAGATGTAGAQLKGAVTTANDKQAPNG